MARVMVWSNLFWPAIGGVEVFIQNLVAALHRRGQTLEVITTLVPPFAREELYQDIPIHRLTTTYSIHGLNPLLLAEERARARALVSAFQPEVMLLLHPMTILIHYQAVLGIQRAPSLYWMQGHDDPLWQASLVSGQALREADYVIACSRELLATGRAIAPEITDRSSVLWNTLPTPALEPTALPWNPPTLIFVGRLSQEKGLDTLVRAFALVVPQRADARLVIAGDGPERGSVEALVQSLGIADRVEFRGWLHPDDVPGAINTATALVLPSRTEGLPLVGVQAAQMGRPLVMTRVGGSPEICVDGETGLLCAPDDVEGLAGQMTRLLRDRAAAEAMGAAARQRAASLFDWETLVDSTDGLLRQLAARGPRP